MKRYKDRPIPRLRRSAVPFWARLRTEQDRLSGRADPVIPVLTGYQWLKVRWRWNMDKRIKTRK